MIERKKDRLWADDYYSEQRINYSASRKNLRTKLIWQSIGAVMVFVLLIGVLNGDIGDENSRTMVLGWIFEDDILAESVVLFQNGADLLNREIQAAMGDTLTEKDDSYGEMPLNGRIISHYGWQNEEEKFNKGIIIEADESGAVRAYADGVIQSIKPEGDSYTIVLAHNNGLISIYGNCANVTTEENVSVKQGEIIAYSGVCMVTKSRIYFELEYNGEQIEPFSYLSEKSV